MLLTAVARHDKEAEERAGHLCVSKSRLATEKHPPHLAVGGRLDRKELATERIPSLCAASERLTQTPEARSLSLSLSLSLCLSVSVSLSCAHTPPFTHTSSSHC